MSVNVGRKRAQQYSPEAEEEKTSVFVKLALTVSRIAATGSINEPRQNESRQNESRQNESRQNESRQAETFEIVGKVGSRNIVKCNRCLQ